MALLPTTSLGGPRAYDIGVLLEQSHPFAKGHASSLHQTDRHASSLDQTDRKDSSKSGARTAVTIFGGWMTDNNWEDVFTPWTIDFRDSTIVGIAGSRGIWRYNDDLSVEIEGQVVRHFGDQDHWEFNLPLLVRWGSFSWNDVIETSVAFGLGPSYASDVPKEEVAKDGDSQQWLVYWVFELELGLAETDWSGVFRLHHRSGAFGLVTDEGGSNVLAIGLRRRF